METSFRIGILKPKSFYFPEDRSSQNDKTFKIVQICKQLSNGLVAINNGGCGMFAIMLDSIFCGSVAQLKFVDRSGDSSFHEIFIKDDYCYDAYQVCKKENLMRQNKIKNIISPNKFEYLIKTNSFFLINRTIDEILNEYYEQGYNPTFANQGNMNILFRNYNAVINSLPNEIKAKVDRGKISQVLRSSKTLPHSLAA